MAMETVHPGRIIQTGCLGDSLSVTDAAKKLGVSRNMLLRVVNGARGISPEMALKLEAAGWSTAEFWLRIQTAYDLEQARRKQTAA